MNVFSLAVKDKCRKDIKIVSGIENSRTLIELKEFKMTTVVEEEKSQKV
jgi:hypothetical protein